ncbi:MAG: type III glutamate--ammonia ligase [candidate division Zixibacteria bacterium]|nr:type III glutamate--ammonia ligase [candidate division Zixibacteria bacterium]
MATVSEVKTTLEHRGIEFLLASFVEMTGASKAKLVPATHIEDLATEGAGFAGFAVGEFGRGPHHPDMAAMPDLNSLTVLPWRPNVAWLACNVHVEGAAWDYCPRTILDRVRARAAQEGYVYKYGVEPEFMLVKRTPSGIELADPLDTLARPCYDQRTLNRNLDFLTTLLRYMQDLGWDPYANDHEDANCQFEINWRFSECMTTADRHTFYKYMVRALAEQNGWAATFMPKPFSGLTGNGAHFHMSLWDTATDRNLFLDENDPNGLSEMAYHWIGGLKAHARAYSAVTAPTVNSYKRLIVDAPRSGATWAPVYITYGGNNRTQMIRLPGPGRVEHRAIDGACNPYLAAAVTLAAGMDGVRRKLDPGPRNDRNLYETPRETLIKEGIGLLPANLKEATDALEQDEVIVEALGAEYAEAYIRAKRDEWIRYHNTVSAWEVDQYLMG